MKKDNLFQQITAIPPEPDEVQQIRDKIKELQIRFEISLPREQVQLSQAITRLMDKLHQHGYKF